MKKVFTVLIRGIALPLIAYIFITVMTSLIFGSLNSIVITGISALIYFIIFYSLDYNKYLDLMEIKEDKFDIKKTKYILMLSFGSSLFFNIILLYFIPFTQNNEMVTRMSEELSNMNIYLSIAIISILVPIAEELLMRGYILNAFKNLFNDKIAILLSGLLFGIIHGNITQGIYAFVLGVFLGIIYLHYNNLLYCIIFHIAANLFIYILGSSIMLFDTYGKMYILFITFVIMAVSLYRIISEYRLKR